MDSLEERQTEAICYLNDNQVEPDAQWEIFANLMGIVFVSEEIGWDIME